MKRVSAQRAYAKISIVAPPFDDDYDAVARVVASCLAR
jgi:hypothetical protein